MSAKKNPTQDAIEILIAEDSPTQAEQLRHVLEQQGYRVTVANNGKHALALLGEHKPALVISDIVMPEVNGYELCRQIKADESSQDIPVILLTSLSDPEDVIDGLTCGADNFITKPYSENYLLTHVAQILAGRKLFKSERVRIGMAILFAGKQRFITADPQQMLSLLLSTYGAAVSRNTELAQARDELRTLNEQLEDRVAERTEALSAEITVRKQAEEALRESEWKLKEAQRLGKIGHWELDLETGRIGWSDMVFILYGRDPKLGPPTAEEEATYYSPEDAERLRNCARSAIETGEPYELDVCLKLPDERCIEVVAIGTPVRDADGRVIRLLGTVQDITERKQAEKRILRQLEHLSALSGIDRVISANLDLELSLSEILNHVMLELGVDAADILILNSDSQMLEFGAQRGFRIQTVRKAQLRLRESFAGRAVLERKLIRIPNIRGEPSNLSLTTRMTGEDFVCYYGVPLIIKGRARGVLEIFHRAALEPDEEWFDFLNTLAGQAAIAVEIATLFEKLQHSNADLFLAYDATIEGWSHALDLHDKETEGHTQRVTEITLQLAKAMGIGDAELVHVRRGALLHDMGKMGVPDSVLLKPGKLTDEEWVQMRKHPEFAYEMLSPIAYLKPAVDIPYCHHEKWDGTGYPRGLKGEQIPLVARLFAVVDVWDALTSDRPYRKAWDEEKVRAHILAGSGTHFDPKVVEAFLQIVR